MDKVLNLEERRCSLKSISGFPKRSPEIGKNVLFGDGMKTRTIPGCFTTGRFLSPSFQATER